MSVSLYCREMIRNLCFVRFACVLLIWSNCVRIHCLPSNDTVSTGKPSTTTDSDYTVAIPCKEDRDCNDAENLICDPTTLLCRCKKPKTVIVEGGHCLEGKRFGEACVTAGQCKMYDLNSTCTQDDYCDCITGFYILSELNITSCQPGGATHTTESSGGGGGGSSGGMQDKNVLIILIVFAVMFVGMCVALNMFSRARFRENRSIFSNPHPRLMHIKLGKQQKHRRGSHASMQGGSRQPSVCSQLSPLPSRAGSRHGSQQSLRAPDKKTDLGGGTVLSVDEIARKLQDSPRRPSTSGVYPLQNGPNSPTIIVTNAPGHRKVDEIGNTSSPVNV